MQLSPQISWDFPSCRKLPALSGPSVTTKVHLLPSIWTVISVVPSLRAAHLWFLFWLANPYRNCKAKGLDDHLILQGQFFPYHQKGPSGASHIMQQVLTHSISENLKVPSWPQLRWIQWRLPSIWGWFLQCIYGKIGVMYYWVYHTMILYVYCIFLLAVLIRSCFGDFPSSDR